MDEVYSNLEKQPIYYTNNDTLPPRTNTYHTIVETSNSSTRIIRSTLSRLPSDPSVLSSSNLMFGLVIQPFAEAFQNEKEVEKVEVENSIFRCKRCSSYINNKYRIDFNKQNKRVATCNLCNNENEIDSSNSAIKSEYFNSNILVPELVSPTVDFNAPAALKHKVDFKPHYIFLIDTSTISLECGIPAYVS